METNLYRKYRPQNFSEVVGQQVVVQTLINSIKNESIAHAYLFSGVRGTGKTSIAKIFARAINCLNTDNPLCGECEICQEFAAGSESTDIFEIDAASNNGVEEIRKIIDNVKFLPIRNKYKVYIIDEVHMLSKGAFNALLKTLEEPPKHVIFILATTEPNKIPVTILSRVQRFEFTRIDETLMFEHLKNVLEKENVSYEDEAIKRIVSFAGGGLRDGLSLLTKVISYAPDVTVSNVVTSLNLASLNISEELLQAIINCDPAQVSEKYRSLIAEGVDETYLVQDLIENARAQLVSATANGDNVLQIATILRKLMEALAGVKTISNTVLYLEVCLIEMSVAKQELQPQMTAPITPVVDVKKVDETVQLDKLKQQAEQLAALTNEPEANESVNVYESMEPIQEMESYQPEVKIENKGLDDVDLQMDALFSNKTGKTVEIPQEMDKREEPIVEEEPAIEEEPIIEEEPMAETKEVEVETISNIEAGEEHTEITIIDTLMEATVKDKQNVMRASKRAIDELNMQKKYGIAKFFEVSTIQGASNSGIVVSVDQNYFAAYDARIDQITKIYSHYIGSSVKVHLITTQFWQENRSNYVRAVKENKETNIYQEALDFFGKDLVTKVNS